MQIIGLLGHCLRAKETHQRGRDIETVTNMKRDFVPDVINYFPTKGAGTCNVKAASYAF
jgi:hypothetical protein